MLKLSYVKTQGAGKMDKRHYPVSEDVFDKLIVPRIEQHKNRAGRPTKISHYQFFCAILFVLRTGIPWRDLPHCYGRWHTIYTRFNRWSVNGLLWSLLYDLQQKKKINIDFVWTDSTTIALHRHGSGALKKKANNLSAEAEKDPEPNCM